MKVTVPLGMLAVVSSASICCPWNTNAALLAIALTMSNTAEALPFPLASISSFIFSRQDTAEACSGTDHNGTALTADGAGAEKRDVLDFNEALQNETSSTNGSDNTNTNTNTTSTSPSSGNTATITVQEGDTFYSISQSRNLAVSALEDANPGVDPASLQPGQTLNLPSGSPVAGNSTLLEERDLLNSTANVTVQAGDTFFSISQVHGITVSALEAANPGVDPDDLQLGQVLNLPNAIVVSGGRGGGTNNETSGLGLGNSMVARMVKREWLYLGETLGEVMSIWNGRD